jgi:hypothetical protein
MYDITLHELKMKEFRGKWLFKSGGVLDQLKDVL